MNLPIFFQLVQYISSHLPKFNPETAGFYVAVNALEPSTLVTLVRVGTPDPKLATNFVRATLSSIEIMLPFPEAVINWADQEGNPEAGAAVRGSCHIFSCAGLDRERNTAFAIAMAQHSGQIIPQDALILAGLCNDEVFHLFCETMAAIQKSQRVPEVLTPAEISRGPVPVSLSVA